MRVLCIFDLPVLTVENRRNYRRFRRMLIKEGFVMIQESVYAKLCLNGTSAKFVKARVRKNSPPEGSIMLTIITEKQFAETEYIIGDAESEYITSTDRLVVI